MRAPWWENGGVAIHVGHVLDVLAEMPAGSCQVVVTSPPYYGLRSYGTSPQIWGGDPLCSHSLEETAPGKVLTGGTGTASAKQVSNAGSQYGNAWVEETWYRQGGGQAGSSSEAFSEPGAANAARLKAARWRTTATCTRCNAWLGELGSEPTPQLYVEHIVEVFRAVRRVLHDSGTIWVNLGDSYSGSWGNQGRTLERGTQRPVNGPMLQQVHDERYPSHGHNTGTPPPGLGPKQLLMMPARVALALQGDGWVLRSDIIWCLSGGTRLYARTYKGDMPITVKDLARLRPETVQLWNGERWTQLLGMSDTPRDTAIEILLRSGERIGCTPHHEWPTQRGLVRADALQIGDVIQTTRLPESATARMPAALNDEMTGWFVGLYLAEGSKDAKSLHIAGHVKETDRYARCQRIAEAFQGSCTWRNTVGLGATITLHGKIIRAIVETYIAGTSSADKRLTNACWQRSDTFLRALLDGYLHGDGHYDAANDRWRLHFRRNYALEADFRTVCARLGISLRLQLRQATLNGRAFPSHRGELRFSKSDHRNVKQDAEVMAIGRSKGRKFWHLGVADAPHLFALSSGVLTSNSKPNPMPESVTDRPTTAHEHLFLLAKQPSYFYDVEPIREPAQHRDWQPGRQNLTAYPGKPGQMSPYSDGPTGYPTNPAGRNCRSVWTIPTEAYSQAHFAVFPRKLVEPCVLAGTSARGQCPACGAPWARVMTPAQGGTLGQGWCDDSKRAVQGNAKPTGEMAYKTYRRGETTGWAPTCACDAGDPVPPTALGSCQTCDAPYERIPERTPQWKRYEGRGDLATLDKIPSGHTPGWRARKPEQTTTTGWRPACHCSAPEPVPQTVLDPFAGSGTTLYVARHHGRRAVGIELNESYAQLAADRLRQGSLGLELW